jgi:hypothetical protein
VCEPNLAFSGQCTESGFTEERDGASVTMKDCCLISGMFVKGLVLCSLTVVALYRRSCAGTVGLPL